MSGFRPGGGGTTVGTANVALDDPYVGLLDENGVPYGVKQVNGKPRVSSMPYTYDIAEGNVANHAPWSKIGYTPTMNTTENDLWSLAGVINFPTAAMGMEVVSSNNVDDIGTQIKSGNSTGGSATTLVDAAANFTAATAVAIGDCVILDRSGASPEYGWVTAVTSATELAIAGGFSSGGSGSGRAYVVLDKSATLGAHAVKIEYLTSTFATKTEIVILNGTTEVPTVNLDLYRINSFRMIAAGTNNRPTGNLSLRNLANTPVYSYITATFTRARNSAYTVPAGKVLYVTEFAVSFGYAANQTHYARLYTRATQNAGFRTPGIFYPYTEVVCANSSQLVRLDIPTQLLSGVDIKVSGISSTTTAIATVALRGWLEDE